MRILLHGPAFWGKSAYSIQIRHLIDMLRNLGVTEIAQSCTFGFQGRVIDVSGVVMLPADGRDGWGNHAIIDHFNWFQPDYVISLMDVFGLDPQVWGQLKWVPIATVDSAPLWPDIKRALHVAHKPIAYSLFGQDAMISGGIEGAGYAPLVYDGDVFKPVDKAEARKRVNLPQDRFIVTIVQANRHLDGRKNFGGQIDAFRRFQHSHPSAFLYLHTCKDASRGGEPLTVLLDELGMVENEHYAFTDQYTENLAGATDEVMRDIYNSSDVLLQATRAEGFGVPVIEAMACGVPVIYTNYGALAEIARGFPVDYERMWHYAGSWYAHPYKASIVEALEQAYSTEPDVYELQKHVAQYRKDVVQAMYWRDIVDELRAGVDHE